MKQRQGIYVAVTEYDDPRYGQSRIYHIDESGSVEFIAKRPAATQWLVNHNDDLFDACYNLGDCGDGRVFRTLEDREGTSPIARRKDRFSALCSVHGTRNQGGIQLYDVSGREIFRTLENEPYQNPVAVRNSDIKDLCSHIGELYDISGKDVFMTRFNRVVATIPVSIRDTHSLRLCSHQGKLYVMTGEEIFSVENSGDCQLVAVRASDTLTLHELYSHAGILFARDDGPDLYRPLEDRECRHPVIFDDEPIRGMCSYKGRIYNSAGSLLYETLEQKLIVDFSSRNFRDTLENPHIEALCSLDY